MRQLVTVRTTMGSLAAAICIVLAFLLPAMASAQTETVTYYHTDAVGSVRATSDGAGTLTHYDYLPFGEPWPSAMQSETRRFAGKERDSETGQDYFGGRYLSSGMGRFTTVDPINGLQKSITDPQLWNRYAYVRNNPLRFVD